MAKAICIPSQDSSFDPYMKRLTEIQAQFETQKKFINKQAEDLLYKTNGKMDEVWVGIIAHLKLKKLIPETYKRTKENFLTWDKESDLILMESPQNPSDLLKEILRTL